MTNHYETLLSVLKNEMDPSPEMLKAILMKYLDCDTTEEDLRELYRSIHFEDLNYSGSFWLASLSCRLQFNGVPGQYLPRIKGVVRRFTMGNAGLLSELTVILKRLSGIPLMLLGSSAMRVYYQRNNIRKFEILQAYADEEFTDEISRLLKDIGWNQARVGNHLSFEKNGIYFELYPSVFYDYIPPGQKKFDWGSAIQTEYQTQKVYVPCPELMVLSLLKSTFDGAVRAHADKTLWICDFDFFRRNEKDILRHAFCMSDEYGISAEVRIMSDLFRRITSISGPELFREAEVDEKFCSILSKLTRANADRNASLIRRIMRRYYAEQYHKLRKKAVNRNG